MNFLLATGMGIAGILSAYMASLWASAENEYPSAAQLTRVTAAEAVSILCLSVCLSVCLSLSLSLSLFHTHTFHNS